MLWFISIIMDRICRAFLLVNSYFDCLASGVAPAEEGRRHAEKTVWIAMGHMGGQRTLQTYTRGVLEVNDISS